MGLDLIHSQPPAGRGRWPEIRNIVVLLITAVVLVFTVFGIGLAAGDQPIDPPPVGYRDTLCDADHQGCG